jgi:Spy/CpxP family protein refolding chaperone
MKKLAVIVAAVSIMALAGLAYGEMGGQGMNAGMMGCNGMDGQMMAAGHHMSMHLAGLNLDVQQKATIDKIKSKMMKESIRKMADIRIVQIELKDLITQDVADMKAVESKVKQLEAMKTDLQLSHIQAMQDIKNLLTTEQKKKLKEMMETMPMMKGMNMENNKKCDSLNK